jgi:hypothetical protein
MQPIEQTVDQRRLARASLTGEEDDSFARLDSVSKRIPGFLNRRGHKQVVGIRANREWILPETEETKKIVVRILPQDAPILRMAKPYD